MTGLLELFLWAALFCCGLAICKQVLWIVWSAVHDRPDWYELGRRDGYAEEHPDLLPPVMGFIDDTGPWGYKLGHRDGRAEARADVLAARAARQIPAIEAEVASDIKKYWTPT